MVSKTQAGRTQVFHDIEAVHLASFIEQRTTMFQQVVSVCTSRWAKDGDGYVGTHFTVMTRYTGQR